MNKRARLSRPKTLLIFGLIFLIIPFVNYYFLASNMGLPLTKFRIVLFHSDIFALVLLLMAFVVGAGLLLVQRWGWYFFLFYATCLIVYDLHLFLFNFKLENFVFLFNSLVGLTAVFYFVRKDISAPYFKMYPRGWRLQKRKPIEVDVEIDSKQFKTTDLSSGGFYLLWNECPYEINQRVTFTLKLEDKTHFLQGGLVRIDENGVGIAFRNNSSLVEKDLASYLKKFD
jgi:hypothetical protein